MPLISFMRIFSSSFKSFTKEKKLRGVPFQIFCDLKAVVTETLTYVSILTIVAFTIERSVGFEKI